MAVSSARNLMSGTGTVSTTSGSKLLTFSATQSLKEGATVVVDPSGTPQRFTIDTGADKTWTAIQDATGTVSGKSFKTSNTSTTMPGSRSRGGTDSYIIPNAAHFLYSSNLDEAGSPDFFTYFDTVFPENGVHPYTKDPYAGVTMASAATQPAVIPDLSTRVRRLEGALRGSSGDITIPDKRVADLVARMYAIEGWANGPGHFGTPPAQGSNTTYTVEQLQSYGDAL